jgi:pimeloyl-ACP methyl ester carboxylesterase
MMLPGTITLPEGTLETAWWGPGVREAPTLVMLHEGLGCIDLWRDVPERLEMATGCGVFAYSRFGYGRSDTTPLPRPLDYMQREAQTILPAVLREAGIERAIFVGHSDGGSIAAVYAAIAPKIAQLLGLVTIAAHFFVEDLNIHSIEQIRRDYETKDLRNRLARYHQDVDTAFYGWSDTWLDPRFRSFDLTGFLREIRVPVLGLQGTDDPYGTDAQLQVLKTHAPAVTETVLIPGARHSPHLEAKDRTLEAITNFVIGLTGTT